MSIIVAKNAVGSSWRKTVGSREWSHVPGETATEAASCVGTLAFVLTKTDFFFLFRGMQRRKRSLCGPLQ